MQVDIFIKRRNNALLLFGLLAAVTIGSVVLTRYDLLKGFTSFVKAFTWGVSSFYPDGKIVQETSRTSSTSCGTRC